VPDPRAFRHKATLWQRSVTSPDSYGDADGPRHLFATLYVSLEAPALLRGRETIASQQVWALAEYKVSTWYIDSVTRDMILRIEATDEELDITDIMDPGDDRQWLVMACKVHKS
jgi:head-tail adaptor